MATYQDFIDSLLPGNYALTKSMELSRVETSGTLWYTKKYLVLYNYIFLAEEIMTNEYVQKVINSFDNYIDSLADSVKENAKKFFYPPCDYMNFKSPKFRTFMEFANKTDFSSAREKREHYARAKECYFALLMGSGGQGKIKEKIVHAIRNDDFYYSVENMQRLIDNAVVDYVAEKANNIAEIKKGDVLRILSTKAIDEICKLGENGRVYKDEIKLIIKEYPCSNEYPGKYSGKIIKPQYKGIEQDAFASIRNERQILYYYGYFHSKSPGGSDKEFSSLTPIGELALDANAMEFLAIWEHQKIKMISQPVTVTVNDVKDTTDFADRFAISFSPYMDILGHLKRNNELTFEQYKYIVSRKKNIISEVEWQSIEIDVLERLNSIKEVVEGFNRIRDKKDEDSEKELKKYLLGIRGDLKTDNGTNTINVCELTKGTVRCTDKSVLDFIYSIYSKLNEYKLIRYKDVFESCESDLRQRYIASVNGENIPIDKKIKIDWDLYNIHFDKFVFLGVLTAMASIALKLDFGSIGNSIEKTAAYCKQNFAFALKMMGIKSDSDIRKNIAQVINSLADNDYSKFMRTESEPSKEVLAEYKTMSARDIYEKITTVSHMADVTKSGDRDRNYALVRYLKSYYLKLFTENETLRCECCKKEAFMTHSGEPYVEFHHLIPFSIAYGPDHYLNLFALCPDCHKKLHFINLREKRGYYKYLNDNNYFNLSFVRRLKQLKSERILKSYHLDYLLADNAITPDEYDDIAV